jgi:TonB family protein
MNSSDICTQQRDREAKAFKAFLRISLLGSAALHGVVLTWMVTHQWERSLQSQSSPIEVIVVKPPTAKPEPPQIKASAKAAASGEPGAIEYLPFGDSSWQASSSQQVAGSAASDDGSVGSPTDLSIDWKLQQRAAAANSASGSELSKIAASNISTETSPPEAGENVKPLTPAKPEDKPRSPSTPSFVAIPSLTAALGSSSLTVEQKPEDKPRSPSDPSFTSIPSLNTASALNQPVLSLDPASASNASPEQKAGSNPNDWAATFRSGIASLFFGPTGGNSGSARTGERSGTPSGNDSSTGVAVRSAGSGNGSSLTKGGAAALGGAVSVNLSQGLAQLFNSTSGVAQQGCAVCLNPSYPAQAALLNHTGKVQISVNGDEHGNITGLQPTNSSYRELERAAIEAVKNWQLKPTAGGYHNYRVEFNFSKDGTVSVQRADRSPAPASQPSQESSPASQLSPTATQPRNPNAPTAVHDFVKEPEAKPESHSTVSPDSADRPAPVSQPQQATPEPPPPQPTQVPTPPASEESSTPGVANLEDSISPTSSNGASATP